MGEKGGIPSSFGVLLLYACHSNWNKSVKKSSNLSVRYLGLPKRASCLLLKLESLG